LRCDAPRSAGDLLYGAAEATQAAGHIIDVQPHPGGYATLVVLQISAAESGALHPGSSDGTAFTSETLPYGKGDILVYAEKSAIAFFPCLMLQTAF